MNPQEPHYAMVLLPVPLPGLFTYGIPPHLAGSVSPGKRVVVSFGPRRLMAGLVRHVTDTCNTSSPPKEITEVLDEEPIIPEKVFQLWEWMARYYLCTAGEVMQAALPALLRLESQTSVSIHPLFQGGTGELTDREFLVVEALRYSERLTLSQLTEITGHPRVINLVQGLIEKGVVVSHETLSDTFRPKTVTRIRLTPAYHQEEALADLFGRLEQRAYKQLELLMTWVRLATTPELRDGILKQRLLREASSSPAVLKTMIEKGIFEEYAEEVSRLGNHEQRLFAADLALSEPQMKALEEIKSCLAERKPVLLHGVTGSGKTEIYIRLIHEATERGQQVLYLLPEIALTSQIINRMRAYFGNRVQVSHSRNSDRERAELWKRLSEFSAADDDPFVLVTARSGIFLPMKNPGLIIVDEEHDHSFKQYDPAPRYQARDTALMMARIYNVPVLLGSATPSVETYHHAVTGKFGLVHLPVRYGNAQLPEIVIADVAEATRRREMRSHYTPQLIRAIGKALKEKKQVILFQNRRGFSLRYFCHTCGWHPGCPHCDVTLIYHKSVNRLKCHYCGHLTQVVQVCPECGGKEIKTAGFGTEKIEEEIAILFPGAIVERMDFDTTRSKNAHQNIISRFEERQTDILIGTQMVTKGLDFSHVGVVGVMNADSMIYFPDFRSFERSFQHIVQVSGRAGRQDSEGLVVVQTSRPSHDAIQMAQRNDYHGMYRMQAEERSSFGYPPFTRLVRIVCKSKSNDMVASAAMQLATALRSAIEDPVMGPEYPLVSKIKNEYLRHILIKLKKDESIGTRKQKIRNIIAAAQKKAGTSRVRFVIDVDPY